MDNFGKFLTITTFGFTIAACGVRPETQETNTQPDTELPEEQPPTAAPANQAGTNSDALTAATLPDIMRYSGLSDKPYTRDVILNRMNGIPTIIEIAGIDPNIYIERTTIARVLDLCDELEGIPLFDDESQDYIEGEVLRLTSREGLPVTLTLFNEDAVREGMAGDSEATESGSFALLQDVPMPVRFEEYANGTQIIIPVGAGITVTAYNGEIASNLFKARLATQTGDITRDVNLTNLIAESLGVAYAIAAQGESYESYLMWLRISSADDYGRLADGRPLVVSPNTYAKLSLPAILTYQ